MTATRSGSSSNVRSPSPVGRASPVLLDVNALMLPVREHFPLAEEVERLRPGARISVPSSVLAELDGLVARRVAGSAAAAALARRFPILATEGRGDSAIVEGAMRLRAWVVTADRELAERLRSRGINVLVPRDRHRLEIHRGRPSRARPARPAARG